MKKDLQKRYEQVCQEYVEEFCKKQGLDFIGWAAGEIGGVACCSGYYFHFQDILWDMNSNQPKGLIIEWYCSDLIEHPNYVRYTNMKRWEKFAEDKLQEK